VADGDSITVRQTDGSQMEVELCGIDAPEVKQVMAFLIFVLTLVAFDVRQSISRYDSATIPATLEESALFLLCSECCKELRRDHVHPDRQRYCGHPNSYGLPEFADRLL